MEKSYRIVIKGVGAFSSDGINLIKIRVWA